MQVRRVALKSRAYVGRKCHVCNLSAKGGDAIVTGGGAYNSGFTHVPCMEQLLEKWYETEGVKPVSLPNRKQLKAERLEEEFEILRHKLLKNESPLSEKMCMAQLERTDTVRCTYKSGHSGPHNPPIIYG